MTDEKDVFSEPTQVNTMYVSGVKLTLEGVNIVVTSWQDVEGSRVAQPGAYQDRARCLPPTRLPAREA
jgi:hypothetical protein